MQDADEGLRPDPDHVADAALLADVAQEAGAIALGWWRRDPRVWHKTIDDRRSPVSEADFAVDHFVADRLKAARPGYGWLSEESEDEETRLRCNRVIVVDPIDGTRAFLAGTTEWSISLAVVENGRPVAAALYRPTTKTLYSAVAGGGSRVDGTPLRVPAPNDDARLHIAGPMPLINTLGHGGFGIDRHDYVASLALRIAMVAEGHFDLALARSGAHDWDIAAADLILCEANGVLADLSGARPRYNHVDPRHGVLVGGSTTLTARAVPTISAATKATPPRDT